uniref:C-type lectin n=1 Tax=Ascaris suum TaxID=6253 RepID=E1AXB5_ASCSU|nr:C-type lectin [Ascaris suum]
MFSTVALVVCIAFFAEQIKTTSAQACPNGWFAGAPVGGNAQNAPCYLIVPGATTPGQARLFCASLSANPASNFGWPESMADMTTIDSRASGLGVRTYWLALERRSGAWVTPGGVAATFNNWRRGQPDGCCGRNVSCIVAGYRGLPGAQWDDTGCDRPPRGLDGYFCRIR